MLTRTAKSCGSDAPMLASSLREEAQATVSNKLVTGKSTKETVKPLRGECRVISGVTVVTMLVCFVLFRTRGCGRIKRPAFPAPSDIEGREIHAQLGQFTPREREGVFDEFERATLSLVIARLDRATQYSRDA